MNDYGENRIEDLFEGMDMKQVKKTFLEELTGKMLDGMTIEITGLMDQKLTDEEYQRLLEELGQLGIFNVTVKENEINREE